jgi:hypothetical protein
MGSFFRGSASATAAGMASFGAARSEPAERVRLALNTRPGVRHIDLVWPGVFLLRSACV